MKILSLFLHKNLTTGNKILRKRGEIAPLFHNIFIIYLISGVELHIHSWKVVFRYIFSLFLQIWYVEVRISQSISDSPMDFEITRVDCMFLKWARKTQSDAWMYSLSWVFTVKKALFQYCMSVNLTVYFLKHSDGWLLSTSDFRSWGSGSNRGGGGIHLLTLGHCTGPFIITLSPSWYDLNNVERDIKHQPFWFISLFSDENKIC